MYEAKGIIKEFSGVRVLHGVDFTITPGKIHGLFGHNGAGKSTLLKIMAGVQPYTAGELVLDSRDITLSSPFEALHNNIACVYQELRLIPELTITQNIFLGREINKGIFRIKDEKAMHEHAKKLLMEYNMSIDPGTYVKDITHPLKQIIEVITNLDRNAKYIFLDEPTTALESKQAQQLLESVRQIVKEKNIGVAIVSHKIDEVLPFCDEVTVLSGGKLVYSSTNPAEFSKETIINAIIGEKRDNITYNKKTDCIKSEPYLIVKNLNTPKLTNISLEACKGEIFGIYGLVGAGRTSLCQTLYGLYDFKGEVSIGGKSYKASSPLDAMNKGVAYLTEERKKYGIIPLMSCITNAVLTSITRFRHGFDLSLKEAGRSVMPTLEGMQIKGNIYGKMDSLSGGNQQKVLISRIMFQKSQLIMLDEPTKGVDLGAKSDIYAIIRDLAEKGHCIVIVSSEEEELARIADRVAIFRAGKCEERMLTGDEITVTALREAVC